MLQSAHAISAVHELRSWHTPTVRDGAPFRQLFRGVLLTRRVRAEHARSRPQVAAGASRDTAFYSDERTPLLITPGAGISRELRSRAENAPTFTHRPYRDLRSLDLLMRVNATTPFRPLSSSSPVS